MECEEIHLAYAATAVTWGGQKIALIIMTETTTTWLVNI
jgi:hypothetical protein